MMNVIRVYLFIELKKGKLNYSESKRLELTRARGPNRQAAEPNGQEARIGDGRRRRS